MVLFYIIKISRLLLGYFRNFYREKKRFLLEAPLKSLCLVTLVRILDMDPDPFNFSLPDLFHKMDPNTDHILELF